MAGRFEKALHALFARAAELVASLVIVLVCFLAIMAILALSFPEGTTLAQLVGTGSFVDPPADSKIVVETDDESFVAVLYQVERRVRQKSQQAIVWNNAETGMPLNDRHAVQSFSGSSATVVFDKENRLNIGENTLVVIRRLERQPRHDQRRATVVVLNGSLSGTLAPLDGESTSVEIVTEAGRIRLPSRGNTEADFDLQIHEDQSSTLSVRGGGAEITWQGQTFDVEPNQSIRIFADRPPEVPDTLPPAPRAVAPPNGARYAYRTFPPKLRFAWDPAPGAAGYRIELSPDRNFATTLLVSETVTPEFIHGNLPADRLFWRVQTLRGETYGPYGAIRSVVLEQDSTPPALEVSFPGGKVAAGVILLRGTVEPGAELYVDSTRHQVGSDGAFEIPVYLEPGVNIVLVEALDAAGNAAYASQRIHATSPVASATQRKR